MDLAKITDPIERILSEPAASCGMIFLICAGALGTAYIAEYGFGLTPCILCLYERVPYFIGGALGILGLGTLYKEEWFPHSVIFIFLSAITFFVGGILAFYHVGVEQHWWKSALEGCSVDFESGSIDELMALFDRKPAARCDEIPWADPILHISMAGYNVMTSFGLAATCLWSAILIRRRMNAEG